MPRTRRLLGTRTAGRDDLLNVGRKDSGNGDGNSKCYRKRNVIKSSIRSIGPKCHRSPDCQMGISYETPADGKPARGNT